MEHIKESIVMRSLMELAKCFSLMVPFIPGISMMEYHTAKAE
jgi:hypothetical protein